MFRQLIPYRLTGPVQLDEDSLGEALAAQPFPDPYTGWTSPWTAVEDSLVHQPQARVFHIALGLQGSDDGPSPRPIKIHGLIDLQDQWLLVDAPTEDLAECFLTALTSAIGPLPIAPLTVRSSPPAVFGTWFTQAPPLGVELNDFCLLHGSHGEVEVVQLAPEAESPDTVSRLLRAGFQPHELGLVWNRALRCRLDDRLRISHLAPAEVLPRHPGEPLPETWPWAVSSHYEDPWSELDDAVGRVLQVARPFLRSLPALFGGENTAAYGP